MNPSQPIVPGISLSPSGEANIDASLGNLLFDLALACETVTDLPVDIEHVVAAIVLAARHGQLDRQKHLAQDDPALVNTLAVHLQSIFQHHGGQLGQDG